MSGAEQKSLQMSANSMVPEVEPEIQISLFLRFVWASPTEVVDHPKVEEDQRPEPGLNFEMF